jgi:hypothetical protein
MERRSLLFEGVPQCAQLRAFELQGAKMKERGEIWWRKDD